MNNFFLLNEAIDLDDYDTFIEGMLELSAIGTEKHEEDAFLKHSSIWNVKCIEQLYSNFGQTEQVISQFIEQTQTINTYIDSTVAFNNEYPECANGFLGIDFTHCSIEDVAQIINKSKFTTFKTQYYKTFKADNNTDKIRSALRFLYPDYLFEPRAIDDITYWNYNHFTLYERLHILIEDINSNPFSGGIGKTEVLKNINGVASKRLDGEHRITYSLKDNKIKILACKGHYT